MKYIIADQSKINSFPTGVAKVLSALEHPEAAVTDESEVWDFLPQCAKTAPEAVKDEFKQAGQKKLDRLSALLGRKILTAIRLPT